MNVNTFFDFFEVLNRLLGVEHFQALNHEVIYLF